MADQVNSGGNPQAPAHPAVPAVQPNEGSAIVKSLERLGETFLHGVFGLLGKFGFPGIVLLLFWFVNGSATDEQKQRIIDIWLLFRGDTGAPKVIISMQSCVE